MEPNLFKYIWRHSKREQITIIFLVLISMPFYFLALDLPKRIVNQGILGSGFEGPGATRPFLAFDLPFGEKLTGAPVHVFDGFDMEQPEFLLGLSFSFFALVFVNGGFKFIINTSRGRMGERMLRRLRYELTDRLLRFQIPHIRKIKPAEAATMIKDEVEPLGGFIGEAFVSPAFLGGQAITAMAFIMVQNVWLGLVAASVVLGQAFLIPRLRVPILRLGRERQLTARRLAGRVAEIVDGAVEVHAHDTSHLERADIASRLGRIFEIRYEIFRRKFFVKFLNNFLAQLTPFVFYAGGGLLAIYGHLDVGALVAVIAAYSDLPSPIKELIDWDQRRNDVQIKYEQVIDQFSPGEILDPALQDPDGADDQPLDGEIEASAVTLIDESGNRILDSIGFTLPTSAHVAIVGSSGSGSDQLAMVLARLIFPTRGRVSIAGRDLSRISEAVTGRRISYVSQDSYLFPLSVRDNVLYGLRHRPIAPPARDAAEAAKQAARESEARRAGNPVYDPDADWTDYAAAGATGPQDIDDKIIEILSVVELEEDVYRFGLSATIDPEANPEIAEAILKARDALPERLAREDAEALVVRFDPDQYNPNATLGENLLFGTPRKPGYEQEALAENPAMSAVLREAGLSDDLLEMGARIARTMVEIFADLPAGHPFFEQFSFIEADDLPRFRALLAKHEKQGASALDADEALSLMRLPFSYQETRHRLGLIDPAFEKRAIAARRLFAERITRLDSDAVAFYRPDAYNAAASLQDNILFGRIAYGQARAEQIVGTAMTDCLDALGLRHSVVVAGLDHGVGIAGKRLSAPQRQKVGLARALLKRPDILIINDALAVMDAATQRRLMGRVLEVRRERGVIWTMQRLEHGENFDQVMVMRDGRIVEQGTFGELNKPGSALSTMMAAE